MSKKAKHRSAKTSAELAKLLALESEDSVEMEFRAQLNVKIVEIVNKKRLTHAEVAELSNASRTRITAILNGNTAGISTDLLLRVVYALGYGVKASFLPIRAAA